MARDTEQLPDGLTPGAVPLAPIPGFDFSTDAVRQNERFDYFCDTFAGSLVGFDAAENWSDDFSARMSHRTIGGVELTHSVCSRGRWARTRRALVDGDESIVLRMLHGGRARNVVGDSDYLLRPGTIAVFPTALAGDWQVLERYRCSSIRLPRTMVETLLRPSHVVRPTLLRSDHPVMKLLIGYIGPHMGEFDRIGAQASQIVGRHIAELVALALGAHREARAEIAGGSLRAARTDAVLRSISRNFASPFVSPATVASSLGVSERHVHRLLEETNRTFYEHLLEARLASAYQQLTDPREGDKSVAEIAGSSGFSNVTYFNRTFRVRFGDTPSGVRAAGARRARSR